MANKSTTAATALFLALSLAFFAAATACGCGCSSCPSPIPKPPKTPKPPGQTPKTPKPPGQTPKTPKPPGQTPKPPKPPSPPKGGGKCPIDTLKLGVCANVLNGLINIGLGAQPPKKPCCTLIQGLADLEAAICLCTALRANILGINLNIPISLSLLINYCGKSVPAGFQCP